VAFLIGAAAKTYFQSQRLNEEIDENLLLKFFIICYFFFLRKTIHMKMLCLSLNLEDSDEVEHENIEKKGTKG